MNPVISQEAMQAEVKGELTASERDDAAGALVRYARNGHDTSGDQENFYRIYAALKRQGTSRISWQMIKQWQTRVTFEASVIQRYHVLTTSMFQKLPEENQRKAEAWTADKWTLEVFGDLENEDVMIFHGGLNAECLGPGAWSVELKGKQTRRAGVERIVMIDQASCNRSEAKLPRFWSQRQTMISDDFGGFSFRGAFREHLTRVSRLNTIRWP